MAQLLPKKHVNPRI